MYYFLSFNEDSKIDCYQFDVDSSGQETIICSGDIVFINYGDTKQSNESVLKGEVSCMADNFTAKNYDPENIHLDSDIFINAQKKQVEKAKKREKSKKKPLLIWKHYQSVRSMDTFLRSGFINYGVVNKRYPDGSMMPETLTEHAFFVRLLLEQVADTYGKYIDQKIIDRAIDFMPYHDLGETENGDVPDNQLRAENVDEVEYACLRRRLNHLKPSKRKQILNDFKIYNQDPTELNIEDRIFRDLCKLTDKLDAILRGLIYESAGYYGTLMNNNKNECVSEGEKRLAAIMGVDTLVDIFIASFVANQHNCYYFDIFYKILKSAVKDVRGEWITDWKRKKSLLLSLN